MSVSQEEKKRLRKKRQRTRDILIIGIPLILLFAVLFVFVIFPSTHFNQGTKINGIDVSGLSISGADDLLEEKAMPDLDILVLGREGEKVEIKGEDVSWGYTSSQLRGIIRESRKEQSFWSSLRNAGSFESRIEPTLNSRALKKILEGSVIAHPEPVTPVDAHIGKDETGGFIIVPEVKGNKLSSDEWDEYAVSEIEKQLEKGQETFTVSIPDEFYENTALPADDPGLHEVLDRLNEVALRPLKIDIYYGETTLYLKDVATIDLDGRFTISDNKIWDYVLRLAEEYDTLGKDRTIKLPDGRTITLEGSSKRDTYGFELDQEKTYDLLVEALYGEKKRIKAKYYTIGHTRVDDGSLDIGDSYIFVDIDRQKVYGVKNGELLISSDLVTGLETSEDTRTPEGIYVIWKMDTACSLVGTEANGTAYDSYVNYWMAFDYHGNGLHDALWREKFGGNIYMTDGSHGCVNLPYETAQTLYWNFDEGDPVLVYRAPKTAASSGS